MKSEVMKKKISELRVVELRSELEKRGIDSKGLKGALVQRLQKAIEDEGNDPTELEFICSDLMSPKATGRRSVGRVKKHQESESEEAPDETAKQMTDQSESNVSNIDTEQLNAESTEGHAERARDHENGLDENDNVTTTDDRADNEQIEANESPDRDETPTRDEEEDLDPAEQYPEEGYQSPDGDDRDMYGGEYDEGDPAQYDDGAGNDFQHDEDDRPEYQVDEEMDEEYGEDVRGDDGAHEEMAEEEPGTGAVAGQEDVDTEEVGDVEAETPQDQTTAPDEIEDASHQETTTAQTVQDPNADQDTVTKLADGKIESLKEGKDEVVSSEVDVLDMLDYDLEITADQNNDDRVATVKIVKGDASEGAASGQAVSDDRTAHREPGSSKPSSSESQRPGSQSSKSGSTAAGKDSGKTSRKDSAVSKEENLNRNLWISGLSSTTRASELKSAFSRYGKVVGAKVVTNVKSPGSKCFGYVTMATADAASKCILHLNNTEMHGRNITVEIAKTDPSASSKKSSSTRKDGDAKESRSKDNAGSTSGSSSRRQSTAQDGGQDEKSQDGKGAGIRRVGDDHPDDTGKPSARSRTDRGSTSGAPRAGDKRHSNRSPVHNRSGSGRGEPDRKRARPLSIADRKVVMDSNKGELRVNVSRTAPRPLVPARWQDEPKPKPLLSRRRSLSPVRRRSFSPLRSNRGGGRGRGRGGYIHSSGTYGDRTVTRPGPRRDGPVLTMDQIRAQQRERERSERGGRTGLSRVDLSVDRERLRREREERDRLRIERERVERERRQLEKDRQERERLEVERQRLEQERKRELERIEREKAEMRRLQEITRYELEQRRRAIKRTYDDEVTHRGSRGSRDAVPVKRSGDRGSGRPERDDGRRAYNSFPATRTAGQRNGPGSEPPPPGTTDYRSRQQGSFRDTTGASKPAAYHDSRARPQDRDDSRYPAGGRTADKYERRSGAEGGRSADYQSQNYERPASDSHRRGAPARDARDGRKVVRERDSPTDYRRPAAGRTSTAGRIELTREQSPAAARRIRRDSSPAQPAPRSSGYKDGAKGGRDAARRGDDRDLREQLRGSRQSNYSESSRGQRRSSRSPNRNSSQYSSSSSSWSDRRASGGSSQAYASGNGSAIPTTGRSSGGSASWSQQWQQNTWTGSAIPSATAASRQVIPPYGTVPSASAVIPSGGVISAPPQSYASSGSDRQSRSFQGSSYSKQPIQRRF